MSIFESSYLSRSLSRLIDPINQAFPDNIYDSDKSFPKKDDLEKIIRVFSKYFFSLKFDLSELEISKFDNNLKNAISKNINKAIMIFLTKIDNLVFLLIILLNLKYIDDSSLYQFGNSLANNTQINNVKAVPTIRVELYNKFN